MALLLAVALTLTIFLWFFIVLYMTTGLCYHLVLGCLRVCNVDVSGIESKLGSVVDKFMGN